MQQILRVSGMHGVLIPNMNAPMRHIPGPHKARGEMVSLFNYDERLNRTQHREPRAQKGGRCRDLCSLSSHLCLRTCGSLSPALSHPGRRFLVSQTAPLKKWPFWLSGMLLSYPYCLFRWLFISNPLHGFPR